ESDPVGSDPQVHEADHLAFPQGEVGDAQHQRCDQEDDLDQVPDDRPGPAQEVLAVHADRVEPIHAGCPESSAAAPAAPDSSSASFSTETGPNIAGRPAVLGCAADTITTPGASVSSRRATSRASPPACVTRTRSPSAMPSA